MSCLRWFAIWSIIVQGMLSNGWQVVACGRDRHNPHASSIEAALATNGYYHNEEDGTLAVYLTNDEAAVELAKLSEQERHQISRIIVKGELGYEAAQLVSFFPQTKSIYISDTTWPRGLNGAITSLPKLEMVWAQSASITPDDLASICLANRLECLMIGDNPLPAGSFEPLGGLPDLKQLDLSNTGVCDRDMGFVGSTPKLKHMWIRNTEVSESHETFLRTIFPEATIIWSAKGDHTE